MAEDKQETKHGAKSPFTKEAVVRPETDEESKPATTADSPIVKTIEQNRDEKFAEDIKRRNEEIQQDVIDRQNQILVDQQKERDKKNEEIKAKGDSIREELRRGRENMKSGLEDENLRARIEKEEILKEFGGLEGNIPVTHRYWQLRTTQTGQ